MDNKRTAGCLTSPDFKMYYTVILIKTACYMDKNRHVDKQDKIKETDVYLCIPEFGQSNQKLTQEQ